MTRHDSPQNAAASPQQNSVPSGRADDLAQSEIVAGQPFPRIAIESPARSRVGQSLKQDVIFWLRRTDQILLGVLLIALLVLLMVFRWRLAGAGRNDIEISGQLPREYYYSININSASWVEWAQLEGIGPVLAKRIVQDREERGRFESIDDLLRIRGLGPKHLEKMRSYLKVDTQNRDSTESPATRPKALR